MVSLVRPFERRALVVGCFAVAVGVAGCSIGKDDADGFATDIGMPMDPDMPSYGCQTGGGTDTEGCETDGAAAGSTTDADGDASTGTGDECGSSGECGGGSCVALAETSDDPERPELGRGPFVCEFVCVAELDDARWCADDGSCCNPDARCTSRGYCIVESTMGGG